MMSFRDSAFFNFFSLWGSRVQTLMVESENPDPSRELSSDTVMEVTRLGTFIKLNKNL